MIDKEALIRPFTRQDSPSWICPRCGKGVLAIKAETFFPEERASSRDHGHEAWEPEWVEYVYSCLLYCSNYKCREVVASAGVGYVNDIVETDPLGHRKQIWLDHFKPKYFEPPLNIIDIPKDCPEKVESAVKESFGSVFFSPHSAANSIRVSIEELLTDLGIKRYSVSRGKRRPVSLHQRISLLPAKYSNIKELILAIKWIGNTGSHSRDKISFDNVMDAFEFLEHILQELYEKKAEKLKKKAKKVNKKKGPVN